MSFHISPITNAIALGKEYVRRWMPRTASKHRYWTRAEKKRVYDAIRERDIRFVRYFLKLSANSPYYMDRLEAAIIILTYLTSGQFLFQYANFRDVIWQKMCEFETGVHDELERIHRISNLEEYKKEELRCSYLYDLRFAIFQLREILRGTNDQTFNQG